MDTFNSDKSYSHLSGEFAHAQWLETGVFLTTKVEVEPISQFDLEEDSDVIGALFFGNVDDESATQIVENVSRN